MFAYKIGLLAAAALLIRRKKISLLRHPVHQLMSLPLIPANLITMQVQAAKMAQKSAHRMHGVGFSGEAGFGIDDNRKDSSQDIFPNRNDYFAKKDKN